MITLRLVLSIVVILLAVLTIGADAGKKSKKNRSIDSSECRYEKGPWMECDTNIGLQKRKLSLKSGAKADGSSCPVEKTIERPCKKQCKYAKGEWTECTDGFRERTDILRSDVSSSDCKPSRQITKPCKKQCTYEKSEWGRCENGTKSKTLTLISNATTQNGADCEKTKTITKNCGKNAKNKRFRKKNNNKENVN